MNFRIGGGWAWHFFLLVECPRLPGAGCMRVVNWGSLFVKIN